ncbi:MAG: MFS transporter [Dehalococcoidia bacterium]|nr:MFS transporter [Dehalococcoidia bacterium]
MTDAAIHARPPLLQQRPFRMLSYTRFSSRVAQNALNFALVLLINEETGKAFLSSLLVLALIVPSTVAGIVAGTAADVFPKRMLVFLGDLARAAVCLYFLRDSGGVAAYYIVAILLATATQFASSAEGAIMPAIVDRSELARANALSQAVGGAAQLIGLGLLTPIVLRVFDSRDALFAICASLFVIAAFQALLIGRIHATGRIDIGGESSGRWWLAGWRTIRSDRIVLHAVVELTLISSTLIILGGLVPKYIEDVLGLPVDIGALILTPAAAGVVLGLRIAGFLAHRVPHGFLSTTGFTLFVACLGLLAFVNQEADFLGGFGAFSWLNSVQIGNFDGGGVMAMGIMFPLGFSYAVVSVAGQTVMDDRVPLHLRGRVGATQAALAAMASSVPVLIAGGLADVVGVTPVLAAVAALIGAVAVANLRAPKEPSPGPRRPVTGHAR